MKSRVDRSILMKIYSKLSLGMNWGDNWLFLFDSLHETASVSLIRIRFAFLSIVSAL